MFAVDRFEPQEQAKADKTSKLASFNERLKRKRGIPNAPATAKSPDIKSLSTSTVDEVREESKNSATISDVASLAEGPIPERRPHREKRVKLAKPLQNESNEAPSKVSHILDKFHKYQDHSAKQTTDNTEAETAEVNEPVVVSDLAPVPQIRRIPVKRSSVPVTAGLPKYLQSPNVVSTTSSAPFSSFPLCKKLQENLAKCEFQNAFAVQAAVLPVILRKHLPEDRKDFLVSAPTGSGKTLAYVLPILETLQSRRITRLRAIVIVPTRELVQQVQSTFETLSSRLGLKIESLSATRPFATEQSLLVNDYEPCAPSNIDILICTPGRLVDHIKSTPRFTLRDLRFLVIDEGDRLLNQSFQGWSAEIDEALKPLYANEVQTFDIFTTKSEERCQKLIFSATLSTDPSLLAQLNLINPALYLVQNAADTDKDDLLTKFTTPSTLDEFFIHSPDSIPKPLVLLTTLHRMKVSKALVFTNSNESAIKLTTLMNRLNLGRCESFTSNLTPSMRRRHLSDFAAGKDKSDVSFLICSDLMARGIDIAVSVVINYDSSISVRQYIHRVGRTARAGHKGRAISLVEATEGKYWWNQIGKKISRHKPVQRVTMFPKKTDAHDEPLLDDQHDVGSESDSESDADNDDDDDDDDNQDGSTTALDATDTAGTQKALASNESTTTVSTQIQLEDIDQEALERVYRDALQSLQNES